MAPKRGLGRGLSNLIPTDDTTEDVTTKTSKQTKTGTVTKTEVVKKVEQTLNINRIEPNKNQPRKEFNEDALQELADSIKQFGVIEPLVVVKRKGYYELIAGERRWRAARLSGLKEVPVVIKDYDDQQIVEIALIENIQREDLNPIEEAHAYERLIQEFNLTQDEVAERVSKSRTAVTNSMRLLKLNEKVQQMVIDDMLTTGHARALLALHSPAMQVRLFEEIQREGYSVRKVEEMVNSLNNGEDVNTPAKRIRAQRDKNVSEEFESLQKHLSDYFGARVKMTCTPAGRGKITIPFRNHEEMERIIAMLDHAK